MKSMFSLSKYISFMIVCIAMIQCKPDAGGLFSGFPEINALNNKYQETPNVGTANNLLSAIIKTAADENVGSDKKNELLEYGLTIAKKEQIPSKQASILFPLIKNNYVHAETPSRLYDLAGAMQKLKKVTVANTLHKSLMDNFPQYEKNKAAASKMTEQITDIHAYIDTLGARIFDNPDNIGINRQASLQYVDACEAFALAYPKDEATPGYLFKAAEVAKSLRTFPKCIALYDWVIDNYPNYENAATSLFLKGFIIENDLGNDEKAKEIYDQFLSKYPKHELANDVQFLIDNLGKTDEEILQEIEARRKDK